MNKHAKTSTSVIRAIATKGFLRSGMEMIRDHLLKMFALFVGGALFFIGLAEILGAFGRSEVLGLADPIFGISFRHLMLVTGIIQLAISLILLFTDRRLLGLGLAAWITANFLVFRIGLWSMGWHHSSGFMFGSLGLSPPTTDVLTSLVSLFLLVGAGVAWWMEHRTADAARFSKAFCPACGGHVKFPIQNLGQQIACPHCQKMITLRKLENLKMSCFFCKEHIEFPAHALGQKISCPHCKMDITLMEQA